MYTHVQYMYIYKIQLQFEKYSHKYLQFAVFIVHVQGFNVNKFTNYSC